MNSSADKNSKKDIKNNVDDSANEKSQLIAYYKVRDSIFPVGTKRRFAAKFIKKVIKNPGLYFRKLNMENIRKLKYYASAEGMANLENRLDRFDDRFTQHHKKIEYLFKIPEKKAWKDYEVLEVPSFEKPLVSIIIPVYNQFHYTYACLKSIIDNTNDVSYEVIIADDNSDDFTKKIKEIVRNIVVIRNKENLRFLLNCNNAAQYAHGKYIHFLNNDTQVQPRWLGSLVSLIESDPTIGMVGSKLIYPDGRLQEAGGILWNDGSAWNYGNKMDPDLSQFNYVKEADYISGASIMIKRELWNSLGGFDTRYTPAYCEDSDLAFAIRQFGYKVIYQPQSVVVHFEGVSNGTDTNVGLKAYQVTNSKKFYEKWKDVLQKDHFENAKNVFLARDRSKNKKCVLFIDHYVPEFDKDAGSRSIFQYIQYLAKKGYNIKFMGDNFNASQPYTTVLEELGVEVLYGPWYMHNWETWIKENAEFINKVFITRPHIADKYLYKIKNIVKCKIIYSVADLHYIRERKQYEVSHDMDVLKSSQRWEKIEKKIFNNVDVILTLSTDEEKELKAVTNTPVVIAPIFVFDEKTLDNYDDRRNNLLFVGGFNHLPNVDGVEWFVNNIFPLIKEKHKTIKLFVVGSNPPDSIKKLSNHNIVVTGFVSDEKLKELYEKCRVCIIPLRFGAGVKGKIVEAMYMGISIVSTSTGIEGLPDLEKIIPATDKPNEFANRVLGLYESEDLRKDAVNRQFDYVMNNFSEKALSRVFDKLFM